MSGETLYDKLWQSHLVRQDADGTALLYIDRHLVHEVTSPQAFEGLRLAGRKPWRTDSILAVPDHNVPTIDRSGGDKSQAALDAAESVLQRGELFGIFPEGTFTEDGHTVPAKHGAAHLAIRTGAPIVPVTITGASHSWTPRGPGKRRPVVGDERRRDDGVRLTDRGQEVVWHGRSRADRFSQARDRGRNVVGHTSLEPDPEHSVVLQSGLTPGRLGV